MIERAVKVKRGSEGGFWVPQPQMVEVKDFRDAIFDNGAPRPFSRAQSAPLARACTCCSSPLQLSLPRTPYLLQATMEAAPACLVTVTGRRRGGASTCCWNVLLPLEEARRKPPEPGRPGTAERRKPPGSWQNSSGRGTSARGARRRPARPREKKRRTGLSGKKAQRCFHRF